MNGNDDMEPTPDTSLAEAVGAWDVRLRSPSCTEEDRTHFATWRDADPTHRAAFERLQSFVSLLRVERGRAEVRALHEEALRAIKSSRLKTGFKVAAAIFVALAVGMVVVKDSSVRWMPQSLLDFAAQLSGAQIYATAVGQRSSFVLEDGSTVELNARSRIKVKFSGTRREVEITAGQALFNVAKSAERPFVVQAGDRQIVAVGTQFDVRLDGEAVQVTLIEGKVRVQSSKGDAATMTAGGNIELTPGKQLVARTTKASTAIGEGPANVVRDIDVAKVMGWRDGRIFFEDSSLEDAVQEMNRYSAVQIRLGSATLAQLRVNGMFRAGEQESFVAALENYFPILAAPRERDEIVLTGR